MLLMVIASVIGSLVFAATNALASESEDSFEIYGKREYIISDIENTQKIEPIIELSDLGLDLEQSRVNASIKTKIDNLYSYLYAINPKVFDRNLVSIIVNESERVGADYRIVTAIMGKESGFCRANYKIYNCFGYLNRVQYSSYEEAFIAIVPRVASKVAVYNWNTRGVASLYKPVDQEGWAQRVYNMAIRVP